jgi:exonuclease III
MKINSWNVRGINASDKRNRVKLLIDGMKADIVLLQETKLSQESYDKTLLKWSKWSSFHSPSIGASRGLAILWNPLTIQGQLI